MNRVCQHQDAPNSPICGREALRWTAETDKPRCAIHKDEAGERPKD